MSKSSWVRGDLTAPTTPEQFHAAIQRQERVIDRLREERDELAARCEQLVQQNDQANHKNRELMARCERFNQIMSELHRECDIGDEFGSGDDIPECLWALWRETPAASLAHVRAEAIERLSEEPRRWEPGELFAEALKIRQSARQAGGEPTKADASIDDDKACVLNVLMNDPEKGWVVVSSGLEQDFKAGMNVFNVRFKDGSEHRISFKIEEI